MSRRSTAQEVAHVTARSGPRSSQGTDAPDICRKVGIAQTTYYRWRQQYAPDQVDTDRRCRELELEVDRLKRLVAELLLDKPMLQDIARKKVVNPNQQRAAADYLNDRYKVSQRRICQVMARVAFRRTLPSRDKAPLMMFTGSSDHRLADFFGNVPAFLHVGTLSSHVSSGKTLPPLPPHLPRLHD